MLKWLNKQGVESDKGFTVQSMSRFMIEYREGEKKIDVSVENGRLATGEPCVIIEPTAFERWNDDPPYISLPAEKQDAMLANFTEAMEFQGLQVSVELRFT